MNQVNEDGYKLICPGIYSSTLFEMEVWSMYNDFMYTDEEYQEQLDNDGRMDCGLNKEKTGLFPTREMALDDLDMMTDDSYDVDRELYFCFIRERAMCCMMYAADYLKEWTYCHGLLFDESLVRNYCEDEFPFLGRPQEMINFHHGDIVMIPDTYDGHWGIVCEVPPTIERVKAHNERVEKEHGKQVANLCSLGWSDDSYVILTSDEGYVSHEHIPAHHVLPTPLCGVPAFVEKKLKEGLHKVDEENV